MMLLTIIVGEFAYSKQEHHSLTDAFAVLFYFLLDAIQVSFKHKTVLCSSTVSDGASDIEAEEEVVLDLLMLHQSQELCCLLCP